MNGHDDPTPVTDDAPAEGIDTPDLVPEISEDAPVDVADAAPDAEPEVVKLELVEPEPPAPSPLELAEARAAELDKRLRSVSKAYSDQKEEMASFRRRTEHQAKIKAERTSFEAVQTFFEPVQNLKRSLASPGQDAEALVSGMQMVLHQFMAAMNRLGLKEVPGVGSTFDPKVHEALAVMPVQEIAQDGMVLMVHADGYEVRGKVLQAAQVVIGKHEPAVEPEPEETSSPDESGSEASAPDAEAAPDAEISEPAADASEPAADASEPAADASEPAADAKTTAPDAED